MTSVDPEEHWNNFKCNESSKEFLKPTIQQADLNKNNLELKYEPMHKQ